MIDPKVKAIIDGEFVQVGLRAPMSLSDYSVSYTCGWADVCGDCIALLDARESDSGKVLLIVPWDNVAAVHVVDGKDIAQLQERNTAIAALLISGA